MFCVRGPSWSTGKIFVRGSMVSQRKTHLSGGAQPGSQFIQLDMQEPEIGEEALVQGLCMLPSAYQPRCDGGLSVAEDTRGLGWVQPFGQHREHHGDPVRGGF